jgi:hypothetical protein
MFALFIGLTFVASGLLVRWLSGGFGEGQRGPWLPVPLLVVALLSAVFLAGRAVRRTAAPIGDVMEAADRVAGGDYGARVEA